MPRPARQHLDEGLRTRPDAAGPAPQRARRAPDATLLQRALRQPSRLRPADLLGLQGTLGNHAVGRMLNAPAERSEREADAMAQRIAGGGSAAPAHDADGGAVVTPQVASGIAAARSGGRALAAPLRAGMERALGADLAGVRLHTDERADRLSRALHARAFTTGSDIFFRNAEFDPAGVPGRQVLAHELAHVVQQRGGRPASGGRPALGSVPAGTVQRLVSRADFEKLAGEPSTKSKFDVLGGTYTDILKLLKKHEQAQAKGDGPKQTKILTKLKKLCTEWMQGHILPADAGGIVKPKDKGDLRKAEFIPALLDEVRFELGEVHAMTEAMPSRVTAALAAKIQAADTKVEEDLKSEDASRYVLTLYVAVQNPDLIPFHQKRMALTIKNETKLFGTKKTGKQIKTAAAEKVVEDKIAAGTAMSDAEKKAAVQQIEAGSHDVGHTWVRLRKFGPKDESLADHSFGFYPMSGYNQPELSVPGEVVYTDTLHAKDKTQAAKDYALTRGQYEAALRDARDTMAQRPDYKLVDYNCTLFAKQVVEAAGQNFLGQAYMKVPANPVSAVTGIGWKPTYNPNALHERMLARQSVYVPAQEDWQKPPQPSTSMFVGFSLGDFDEESSGSEVGQDPVDLLMACGKDTPLTLGAPIAATNMERHTQVTIPKDTRVRMYHVEERDEKSYAIIESGLPERGRYRINDLDALCAALGLGA